MKNPILVCGVAVLLAVSCEKKPETVSDSTITSEKMTTNTVDSANIISDQAPEISKNNSASVISTTNFDGDGKRLKADFMGDQAGTMSVKISIDGKEYTLPQKEAWAKGAVYADDKIEFTNNGQTDSAVLKIDGKTYHLTEIK